MKDTAYHMDLIPLQSSLILRIILKSILRLYMLQEPTVKARYHHLLGLFSVRRDIRSEDIFHRQYMATGKRCSVLRIVMQSTYQKMKRPDI